MRRVVLHLEMVLMSACASTQMTTASGLAARWPAIVPMLTVHNSAPFCALLMNPDPSYLWLLYELYGLEIYTFHGPSSILSACLTCMSTKYLQNRIINFFPECVFCRRSTSNSAVSIGNKYLFPKGIMKFH
jgi:hypothetical protein